MDSNPSNPTRRYDLDWLRIIVFGLLILYHVGMFYVPWDWHVKSSHEGAAIRPLMLLTNPWRLALLFLISGVATRFIADGRAPAALARTRSARLLIPLAFGMLVIVPPQTWCEIVEKLGYAGDLTDFYGKYIGFHDGWRPDGKKLIVPTWNHLWFVAYLWVYTILVAGLIPVLRSGRVRALGARLETFLRGPGLLLVPWIFLAAARTLLRPVFGETHALVDDWYLHCVYFAFFLFGFVAAKSAVIWTSIGRSWPWAIGIALICWLAMVATLQLYPDRNAQPTWLVQTLPAIWSLDQWCASIGMLGVAQRWLNCDWSPRAYLTQAIFPYYIVHQTVIVVLGHNLSSQHLPVWLEATAIIGATAVACVVTYEIVRRVAWLRPLFGLRPETDAGSGRNSENWIAPTQLERAAHRRPGSH